jgi:uncharacterized protein YecE (DUF72 family)
MAAPLHIGTAGWGFPKSAAAFADAGPKLSRYASRFNGVEINSSFYRPHRRGTYERWADTVPPTFRFAVKAPREITHERRLVGATTLIGPFLDQIRGLGAKLGPVLFQLPPSLGFDAEVAAGFFAAWRREFDGPTICEPRHVSWFSEAANRRLACDRITRAVADPALCAAAAIPGGFAGDIYFRLHGSPNVYESPYGPERLEALASALARVEADGQAWCVFDKPGSGRRRPTPWLCCA